MPKAYGEMFDRAVLTYEAMRPGYPAAVYNDIFRYRPIDGTSRVVEVGIGTGQATLPVLETGCTLTAVEPGANLAGMCREKFRAYPRFSVVVDKFENFLCADDNLDLVYSATAFHWINEEVGYLKVRQMLKRGGAFARFANHPFPAKDDPQLFEALQNIYKAYRPDAYAPPVEYTSECAKRCALLAEQYGFCDMAYQIYSRTRTRTSADYVALLSTYSDNLAMEEDVRRCFFAEIQAAIDAHGGRITIFDTIDLQLARKP